MFLRYPIVLLGAALLLLGSFSICSVRVSRLESATSGWMDGGSGTRWGLLCVGDLSEVMALAPVVEQRTGLKYQHYHHQHHHHHLDYGWMGTPSQASYFPLLTYGREDG